MMQKLTSIKLVMLGFVCFLFFNCGSFSEDSYKNTSPSEPEPVLEDVFYIPQNIEGKEEQREVLLHMPENFDQTKTYPVVIAFHGRGGQNKNWIYKLSKYVEAGEFIGVYPQGHSKSWNLGHEPSKADEVYFFNQMMLKLGTYSFFDPTKVYGIGSSNGAGMINKLAMETSHFSAVAALASQLTFGTTPNSSTSPVSIYQMCGTADPLIPYNGGISVIGHDFLSASDSALSWANSFNCATPSVEKLGEDQILIYADCESGKEVRFHSVENAGHNLNQPSTPNFYDPIWEFLKRF